jgi:uncharacterized protein (TIGR02246 family)
LTSALILPFLRDLRSAPFNAQTLIDNLTVLSTRDNTEEIPMKLLSAIAGAALAASISAQAAEPVDAHQVALSIIDLWDSTYNKHDAKAISMLFVPGGVFLPPDGSAPRVGRDQIESYWRDMFASIGGHQELVNKEAVLVNSDTIIMVNQYKVGGDPAHGDKFLTGRATSTLVNTPEGWRYASLTPQPAQ